MSIDTRSLSDQAFFVIRGRILSTSIPPLVPIRQDALAQELGISKIPLREALGKLEQHGLLFSSRNRGFFVPALTGSEAEEVFALRLKIEPAAAAAASLDADEDQRMAARHSLAMLEAKSITDAHGAVSFNRAFHPSLVAHGQRHVTVQLVERLHVLAERYVRKHLEPEGRQVRARKENRAILKAWLARDTSTIVTLLSKNISETLRDLRTQLLDDRSKPAVTAGKGPMPISRAHGNAHATRVVRSKKKD